ncbi:hypothetical protein RhiirA5_417055 [Rhizophagus irregularis]|uniref:F-box domain-containing protein n=1 Tax=Rhizophagus irregularis TaxID=588596 RepID=A0A2N0PND7_9GLOM|nr:hypothetical protein RhiirA5_417055 [Rhizophagus irregularis]
MVVTDKDCLPLIFEELHDDRRSLYSCLLVNRLWCKTVVPILWKDPWKFLNNLKDFNRDKLFLNTILLHLSEESKNYLRNQDSINKYINIPQQQQTPLFNYIHLIKYIRKKYQCLNVKNICYQPFYDKCILEQEVYKLFIDKCTSLKFLDITDIKCPIYEYPGAAANLSRIKELQCKSCDDEEFFYGLTKMCNLIEKLCILYTSSNPGLAKLIEIQKNLKYIKISVNRNFNMMMKWEDKCQMIDQAIIKHSNKLIYLDIPIESISLSFYINFFPKLINLRTFILDGNMLFDTGLEDQLDFPSYTKLQVIHLDCVSFSTAKRIIQNTERNLQIIWTNNICYSTVELVDQSRNFIQIIYQNCPYLKYVKFSLKGQYFEEIKQLLINCKFLEGLYIDVDKQINNYLNGDELLDILIKFAPNSLFKLQLNFFEFKTKNFESFFNKWEKRKSLWLYLNNVKLDEDYKIEFKDLIKKYESEEVIKKYESDDYLNFINDYTEFITY